MTAPTRHNPLTSFGADDDDDAPVAAPPVRKPMLPKEEVERIAKSQGFDLGAGVKPAARAPVRQQRRYTTGRSGQINLKATDETIDRLHRLADGMNRSLAEILELAVEALENAQKDS